MKYRLFLLLALLVAAIAACSPTPTEPSFAQPLCGSLTDPTGKPAKQWNGIPIMPEAFSGEEAGLNYIFEVNTTREEVQDFYTTELEPLGWSLLVESPGPCSVHVYFERLEEIFSYQAWDQPGGSGTIHVTLIVEQMTPTNTP